MRNINLITSFTMLIRSLINSRRGLLMCELTHFSINVDYVTSNIIPKHQSRIPPTGLKLASSWIKDHRENGVCDGSNEKGSLYICFK